MGDRMFNIFKILASSDVLGTVWGYMGKKLDNIILIPVDRWVEKFFGVQSPYRGPIMSLLTVAFMFLVYKIATRAFKKYLISRDFKDDTIRTILMIWRYAFVFIIVVFAVSSLSGSIKALGISAGFLGMMLGWSLQAPVTGIAAWLMIIIKRPFKIGDRIVVGGIMGDVTDITLTHLIMNQVGGTIGGEERSGRGILIPTAIMFSQIITNYTFDVNYILDEVPVRITFDSDWDEAERILLDTARTVTKREIEETGEEPFIRAEFFDAGVLVRLRYHVEPAERQRISSDITKVIFHKFGESDKVWFCYPHSEIIYQWKDEVVYPKSSATAEGKEKKSQLERQTELTREALSKM